MIRLLIAGLALTLASAGGAWAKPFVVILADARGTVATDLMAPYAVLAESGAVDVRVVAESRAPARLTPGYAWVAPQMTLADLEQRRPDVVIVPAMAVEDDAERAAWLWAQARRGVRIMSICNGGLVLAKAGLLDGRQATLHWFNRPGMARERPQVTWREDLRWVTDGRVTTTAGISASEPATLQLLRELAGEDVMRETARRLSLPLPDQRHRGADYHLTLKAMRQVAANRLAFWSHEDVALPLASGFDEIAFGTASDAWSRTYRSTAWMTSDRPTVRSRRGLTVIRAATPPRRFDRTAVLPGPDVMLNTFAQVRRAYGETTARFVAMQFEHPWGAVSAWSGKGGGYRAATGSARNGETRAIARST